MRASARYSRTCHWPTTEQNKRTRDVPCWLSSTGILFMLLLVVSCGETKPRSWESLSVSGKGVAVAKTKDGAKINYYLFSGTNRTLPLHVFKERGKRFASLESLLDFIKLKPDDVMLFEATSELVRRDDGLEVLSAQERDRIWGKAKQSP